MLILLPPSEGKAKPEGGDPVDLGSLVFGAELGARRGAVLDALDPELREAPAGPAAEVYTGVLYQRLDLGGLPAAARRRAGKNVLIASALWGFVRPQDRIPHYRLPPTAKLDGIGPLAAWWRESLAETMPDEPAAVVVDMRSGAYAAAWKPKQAQLLPVSASTRIGGKRKAVTHMVKAVRGEVARALLVGGGNPSEPEQVAAIVSEAGFEVELSPGKLDVIVG
jgi:cytoplasmic iron level regulating protein YaaA (DUF328/UPF0246 family)